jgi:hypothetical protein
VPSLVTNIDKATMNEVTVSIRLIDGGFHEYTTGTAILEELRAFEQQGLSGRSLIDNLISDDWGAPPTSVTISGKDEDGKDFVQSISYD